MYLILTGPLFTLVALSPYSFSKDRIFLDKATGPSKKHSQVHNNAIFVRIRSDFIHVVQHLRNPPKGLRVLTLNDTLAPGFTHKGMKPIKSVTDVRCVSLETGATLEATTSWTQRVVETLLKVSNLTQYGRTLYTLYVSCIHWVLCVVCVTTLTGPIGGLNCEVLLYINWSHT